VRIARPRGVCAAYHRGMRCNIDAQGKKVRLIGGFVTLGVALLFAALGISGIVGHWWPWAAAGGSAAGAAFQIYEGWAGWCAFRAMGMKTRV
jgi:hypothetical protein